MLVRGCVLLLLCGAVMAAKKIIVPNLAMNNGQKIPVIALGTYLGFDKGIVTSKGKEVKAAVQCALEYGYRHFDTASIYGTEKDIGEALHEELSKGTVKREEIFVTTKLWPTHHARNKVLEAAQESLKNLDLDYMDLYLVHWPVSVNEDYTFASTDYMEAWRGMEDVQKRGLTKAIGLSNFNQSQITRILNEAEIKPAVLQVEVHPNFVQKDLVNFAQNEGLVVMGYSPFGSLVSRFGTEADTKANEAVSAIAKKYGKTVYQLALRWQIDRNIIPIPKTVHNDRLLQNIDIFDFKLTNEEIDTISNSYPQHRITTPSFWQEHPYYPFEKTDTPIPNPFVI